MTRWLIYPSKFEPINAPANPVAPTQWFGPLSEPRKLVVAAAVLVASGCTLPPQQVAAPATTPAWGWHVALSQPVTRRRQFFSDAIQPPLSPARAPNGWQAQLSELARTPRKAFQIPGLIVPPQSPTVIVAVPQGWYKSLPEPVLQAQFARTRTALVTSPVFSFKPPATPPPAPLMAFYCQLSCPVFAQVKYPGARVHVLPWNLLPPPVVIPPLWAPQGAASPAWTGQVPVSGLWTPQPPGVTTWSDQ